MTRASTLPVLFFALFLALIAAPLVVRIAAIRPLFLDASVRDKAQVAIVQVAAQRGWFVSDLSIRRVDDTALTLVRREHQRRGAPSECIVVKLSTFELFPCAD